MAGRDSIRHHADRYQAEARAGQALTAAFGAVFLVVGAWGFALTGFGGDWLAHDTGEEILGLFEVNALHNAAHVLFGALGLAAAARLVWSLWWNLAVALAYLGLFAYGLAAVDESWDVLALNDADNWLHLGLGLLGVALAVLCRTALVDLRRAATIDLRERTLPPEATRSEAESRAARTTARPSQRSAPRPR